MIRHSWVAAAFGLALLAPVVQAQDWPMFMADARHAGQVAAPKSLDIAGLKPAWQLRVPAQVSASPIVAGGRLFIAAENGNLYAVDLQSHKTAWIFHVEAAIASTPAVVDGKLYFLGNDGVFYALEAATGKLLWRFATGGERRFAMVGSYGLPKAMGPNPDPWDFYMSSPLVHDGRVYFGSSDHNVYALDAVTGAKVWAFTTDDSVHSSPAYGNGRIFVGTWGTKLYALDAKTGAKVWDFQGGKDPETGILQGMAASPSVDDDTVYVGSRDGHVYAFGQADGRLRWTYDAAKSWVLSTAAVDAQSLYFGTSDTGVFVALDKRTGKERFRVDTHTWTYTSPVVVADRYVFVGTMTGELYAVDKADGRVVWRYQTPEGQADVEDIIDDAGKLRMEVLFAEGKQLQAGVEPVKALGAFVASPVWADGKLIAVTATGDVLVFAP